METWDSESWTARILGTRWHEYSPPGVLHWFSRRRLAALLENLGYEVIQTGKPKKRIESGHAKSLLQYKLGQQGIAGWMSQALHLVPEGIEIPYPCDDVFWILARRPA